MRKIFAVYRPDPFNAFELTGISFTDKVVADAYCVSRSDEPARWPQPWDLRTCELMVSDDPADKVLMANDDGTFDFDLLWRIEDCKEPAVGGEWLSDAMCRAQPGQQIVAVIWGDINQGATRTYVCATVPALRSHLNATYSAASEPMKWTLHKPSRTVTVADFAYAASQEGQIYTPAAGWPFETA